MFGKMMNNFYYGKSGKGDFRKEDLPKNRWQLFWEMLRVRFAGLCRLNLMTVAAWLPLIILIGYCVTTLFNVLMIRGQYDSFLTTGDLGDLTEEQVALLATMDLDQWLGDMGISLLSTFCLWAIPCIAITGPVQAGLAYVTRNWSRDEHAFIWADFKDAVKENWKQGLGVSFITSLMPIVMYVGYRFYGQQAQTSVFFMVPQMLILMIGVVWMLSVTFMYPMMVSYRVSFGQLIKNSIVMAIGRLPQTVGIRLILLVPSAICVVVFLFTGSLLALLVLYCLLRWVNYPSMELITERSASRGMELEAYTELYLRGALQEALSDRSFVFFIAAMAGLGLITWGRESGQLRLYRQTGHSIRTAWLLETGLVLLVCVLAGLLEPLCVVGRYWWFWRAASSGELARALVLRTLNVLVLAPVGLLVALLAPRVIPGLIADLLVMYLLFLDVLRGLFPEAGLWAVPLGAQCDIGLIEAQWRSILGLFGLECAVLLLYILVWSRRCEC